MQHAADNPVLAVDLGGTQIRAALVTPDLAVHCRRSTESRDEEGVDVVIGRIVDLTAAVRADAARQGLPAPIAIGISAPGPLDPWRGIVLAPPNLLDWRDVPLADEVEAALDMPALLERDANVAVTAEWRYGAARDTRNAVYITVSTGIGGGVINDGRLLSGNRGGAGEVGHLGVEIDGPICGCGGIGHVEAIASGTALARDGRALLEGNASEELARLAATGVAVDAELVARAASLGDNACTALLEHAWVAIGATCASLVNLLDPEVIVIGGGIAEHTPRLFEVVHDEVRRRALPTMRDRLRIEPASLGADVSLIGSLPIVNERIDDPAYRRATQASRMGITQQGAPHS